MTIRTLCILVCWVLCSSALYPGDPKEPFDIKERALARSSGPPFLGWKATGTVTEVTVLPGFHITWGTVQGRTPSALDNSASLLFGHPYAKTSHPEIALDGAWSDAATLFPPDSTVLLRKDDSTITIRNGAHPLLTLEATYHLQQSGGVLRSTFRIINKDAAAHSVRFGHLLDPALGNRGDAVITMNGKRVTTESSHLPSPVTMAERNGETYGIRAVLDFPGTLPSAIVVRNWSADAASGMLTPSPGSVPQLYDAVIASYWSAVSVASHDTLSATFELTLSAPNFGTFFTRWDLPRALGMEDGIMHPFAFPSMASLFNTGGVQRTVSLRFIGNNYVESSVAQKDTVIAAQQHGYLRFPLGIIESYEDMVVDLSLVTAVSGSPADTLTVPVFIPRTPVSDTGLTVKIDSLITASRPKISARFEVERTMTGQRIFSLRPQNIFLYEDGLRIPDFTLTKDTSGGVNALDLVFVLDVTGSMGGTIDGVKNNIIEFADSLKKRGIDYRLGMVTFLDIVENVYPFTGDVQVFKQLVSAQYAHGGGDAPENSLEALYQASQFPFRDGITRQVIWITDINYHENNAVTSRTKAQVIEALLQQDVIVHAIGPTFFQTDWYNPIIEPTGGKFYSISGNFRDILLDISRLRSSSKFLLAYSSPSVNTGPRSVKIEVHVGGLGGSATVSYSMAAPVPVTGGLSCHPNPFNPQTTIRVQMPADANAVVTIVDILGKLTRQFRLKGSSDVVWDATDEEGRPVSSGIYLIRSEVRSQTGVPLHAQTTKVIYLK